MKTATGGRIKIRPADSSDYPDISRLAGNRDELFRAFPNSTWPFNARQLHFISQQRCDLTVITENGEVAGFADLYGIQPQNWGYIGNVIVGASHRSKGLGRRLVTHMIDTLFSVHGLPEARISVFQYNMPALTLYRQLGFSIYESEERRNPSGSLSTLLHMRLPSEQGRIHRGVEKTALMPRDSSTDG